MRAYLLVALGSALGGAARFGSVTSAVAIAGPAFPFGTLLVNVVGSLLIGVVAGLADAPDRSRLSSEQRTLLATGFCGGFTTFSFFSWQVLALASSGQPLLAALYVLLSLTLPLLAAWYGYTRLAGWLIRRRGR